MSGLLAYVQDQQQYIGLLLLSHIQLTLLSVAIAVCIGAYHWAFTFPSASVCCGR